MAFPPVDLALFAAAATHAAFGFTDLGVFWPDEIHQSMSPAHRWVFGFGAVAWEFQAGARSWFFPGVLGSVYWLLSKVPSSNAWWLIWATKGVMTVASVGAVFCSMRLARRLGGAWAQVLAGVWGACFPALLLFAGRGMSELFSAPLITAAALLLLDRGRVRSAFWAGVLSALAVFVRYQNGLVLLGLAALVGGRRDWKVLRSFLLAAAGVGLAGGALDWVTWGRPFHSFWTYVQFNWLKGGASAFGTAPLSEYFSMMGSSAGVGGLAVGIGFVAVFRRPSARGVAAVVAVFVLVHSFIPHKEFRFLVPVMPLALALSAVGWVSLYRPEVMTATGAALGVVMLVQTPVLTFAQMGQYKDSSLGQTQVRHAGEGVNRLLLRAGRLSDVCGLAMLTEPTFTGAYVYFHRDLPLLRVDWDADAPNVLNRQANYAIAPPGGMLPPSFVLVDRIQGASLGRRDGPCQR